MWLRGGRDGRVRTSEGYDGGFGTLHAAPVIHGDRLELLRDQGYSYRQIAYMTGTPKQTVHDRVRGTDRRKVPPLPAPSPFSLKRPI